MTELPWDDGESVYEVRSRQACPCGCQDAESRAHVGDLAPVLEELARKLGVLRIGGIGHAPDWGD